MKDVCADQCSMCTSYLPSNLDMLGSMHAPHSTTSLRSSGSTTMLATVSANVLCMLTMSVLSCLAAMDPAPPPVAAPAPLALRLGMTFTIAWSNTTTNVISKNLLRYSKTGEVEDAALMLTCTNTLLVIIIMFQRETSIKTIACLHHDNSAECKNQCLVQHGNHVLGSS